MKVELRSIKALRPYEQNPRQARQDGLQDARAVPFMLPPDYGAFQIDFTLTGTPLVYFPTSFAMPDDNTFNAALSVS